MDLIIAIESGQNVFSSEEVRNGLGIPEGTLRGWKSKLTKTGALSNGVHHFQNTGATFWTLQGLAELCKLKGGDVAARVQAMIEGGTETLQPENGSVSVLARSESVPGVETSALAHGGNAPIREAPGTELDSELDRLCRMLGEGLAPELQADEIASRVERYALQAATKPIVPAERATVLGNAGNVLAQRFGWAPERMQNAIRSVATQGATQCNS